MDLNTLIGGMVIAFTSILTLIVLVSKPLTNNTKAMTQLQEAISNLASKVADNEKDEENYRQKNEKAIEELKKNNKEDRSRHWNTTRENEKKLLTHSLRIKQLEKNQPIKKKRRKLLG